MCCHVDRAIRSVPDVSDVQVFLGAEKARVAYQSNAPDPDLIRQAVKNAGYEAIFEKELLPAESTSETEKSLSRRLAAILGIVFGLVLFVAVVGEWLGLFEQLTDLIPWFVWLVVDTDWRISDFQECDPLGSKRPGDFSYLDDLGCNCGNCSERMADCGCCCAVYAGGRFC